MSLGLAALIILAGAVGSCLRYLVGELVPKDPDHFPLGTALVNTSGSFAIGLALGLSSAEVLSPEVTMVFSVGLLGGYTTFSTASVDSVQLAMRKHPTLALTNSILVMTACLLLATVGFWLTSEFLG
ncbi:fluoride efflux transporter CrcB [Humidisolicoccus flavus]|uniref:fluoride efflux transporter CrcB n=1 Tax=Humidisolicoccus flavus TaxID=3111414 RepID=UPI00324FF8FF